MKRRLTSLRDKRGFDTFSGYFDAVKNNRDLLTELLDRMTINVSEFFRNRSRWDRLKFNLLPELIKDKIKSTYGVLLVQQVKNLTRSQFFYMSSYVGIK